MNDRQTSDEVLVWLSVRREVQIVYMWSSRCHCIPNPIISRPIEIQTGFTFRVRAYPGCPGKEAVERVY